MPLQKLERPLFCRKIPDKAFYFIAYSLPLSQSNQSGRRSPCWGKDACPILILLQVVTGQSDSHMLRLDQKLAQDLLLLGRKVCKSIQPQILAHSPAALLQLFSRSGQAIPRVQCHVCRERVISPTNQPQVPEFIPFWASCFLPRGNQRLRGDTAALQLIHSGQQSGEESRALRCAGIHRQDL